MDRRHRVESEATTSRMNSEREHQFSVDVPSGRLVGWSMGSGPPVITLHGGPGLSDYTHPLTVELAAEFRVVRYQQRGLSPSLLDGPFAVETHVADLLAILDGLGLDRPVLAGHSWGGHLALHFAVAHPDRVSGLLIIDPLGAVGDGGAGDLGRNIELRLLPDEVRQLDEIKTEPTPPDYRGPSRSLALIWPAYFSSRDAVVTMPEIQTSSECHRETMASIVRHLESDTLGPELPRLNTPTQFLMGADSPIPPHHGEATARLIPGAAVRVLPQCGHFPWIECPGHSLAALRRLVPGTAPNGQVFDN